MTDIARVNPESDSAGIVDAYSVPDISWPMTKKFRVQPNVRAAPAEFAPVTRTPLLAHANVAFVHARIPPASSKPGAGHTKPAPRMRKRQRSMREVVSCSRRLAHVMRGSARATRRPADASASPVRNSRAPSDASRTHQRVSAPSGNESLRPERACRSLCHAARLALAAAALLRVTLLRKSSRGRRP